MPEWIDNTISGPTQGNSPLTAVRLPQMLRTARTLLRAQRRGRKTGVPVPIGDRHDTPASRDGTDVVMKQGSTRVLFEYWNRQRGPRPAPTRPDIDPAGIRRVLGDTFILSADFVDEVWLWLAGTRVCALFAREIKGEAFSSMWSELCRKDVDQLTAVVTNENIGVVAGLVGRVEDDDEVEAELLLLPLAPAGPSRVRAIGVLAPLLPPAPHFGAASEGRRMARFPGLRRRA